LFASTQVVINFPENPWSSLSGTTDHYRLSIGVLEHLCRLDRGVNIAVAKYRDLDRLNNGSNGVVLRFTGKSTSPCAPMNRERGNAAIFCNARDTHRIAVLGAPSSAKL